MFRLISRRQPRFARALSLDQVLSSRIGLHAVSDITYRVSVSFTAWSITTKYDDIVITEVNVDKNSYLIHDPELSTDYCEIAPLDHIRVISHKKYPTLENIPGTTEYLMCDGTTRFFTKGAKVTTDCNPVGATMSALRSQESMMRFIRDNKLDE